MLAKHACHARLLHGVTSVSEPGMLFLTGSYESHLVTRDTQHDRLVMLNIAMVTVVSTCAWCCIMLTFSRRLQHYWFVHACADGSEVC